MSRHRASSPHRRAVLPMVVGLVAVPILLLGNHGTASAAQLRVTAGPVQSWTLHTDIAVTASSDLEDHPTSTQEAPAPRDPQPADDEEPVAPEDVGTGAPAPVESQPVPDSAPDPAPDSAPDPAPGPAPDPASLPGP